MLVATAAAAVFSSFNFPGTVGGAYIISPLDFPDAPDKKIYVPVQTEGAAPLTIKARAVLVRDRDSKTVMFEKNPSAILPIASLTKLMTAIVVSKKTGLDDIVEIQTEDLAVPEYRADLAAGEKISVRNLLAAMLVASANDAAMALARHTGSGVPEFVTAMNREAKRLGMDATSFTNPVGFDDPAHYSTARDLARLVDEFLLYPELLDIAASREVVIASEDGANRHRLATTNKLMTERTDIRGLKTGYTEEARGNLIILADVFDEGISEEETPEYYSIVLGSDDREQETAKILDWIKGSYQWKLN